MSEEQERIITEAKKSLIFRSRKPWCKKDDHVFNVGQGSFEIAEMCQRNCLQVTIRNENKKQTSQRVLL